MKYRLILILIFLSTGCAYKPITDHRGLNGKQVAHRYNDDLSTCKEIANNNSSFLNTANTLLHNWYFRPLTLYIKDHTETDYTKLLRKCMTNRGHSVLN